MGNTLRNAWGHFRTPTVDKITDLIIDGLSKLAVAAVVLLYGLISEFFYKGEFTWTDLGLEFTWTELGFSLLLIFLVYCIRGGLWTLAVVTGLLVYHPISEFLSKGELTWPDPGLEFTWTELGLGPLFLLLVLLAVYRIRAIAEIKETAQKKPDVLEKDMPLEILQMDEESIQIYKEALRGGKEKVYNIRVMVVGLFGVGKTTLSKRLLGDDVDISEREITDGIDVHIHRCRVSLATDEWSKQDKDAEQSSKLQRFFKLLNDQGQGPDISDKQVGNSKVMHQKETAPGIKDNDIQHVESTNLLTDQKEVRSSSKQSDLVDEDQSSDGDNTSLKASSQVMPLDKENSFGKISQDDLNQMQAQSVRNADKSVSKDSVKNIIQLIKKNADKLARIREEYSPLALWDFAGQYIYYTTHQTFLTQRAVYLLVINLTQKFTDCVKDDKCFLDIEGEQECQVRDLVQLWLNSIHSCASSIEPGSPPVIIVGTHKDVIPQDKDIEQECESVFRQIRQYDPKERPAIIHLADEDFSISNNIVDPKLKDLQKKIVKLASKQRHWGESIPARWLLLEEGLMSLKAKGVKVITYQFLEEMNQDGDVRIESKEELDLFLKYQHDIGNILYFSTNELRNWIMLEPKWLIKAMRSLITAEMFILRKHPKAIEKWRQFNEKGMLTEELLDVIWSKEEDTDLYDYKKLLLLFMEQLSIIARPMLLPEDRDKAGDFFLAPCMLRTRAPKEVISPTVKPEMESSSVLCFVFREKFFPSPLFHRLLAVCVAKWPIHQKMGTSQIFCGCGVFQIHKFYRLTLYFKSYVIYARVTGAATKHQTLDAKVCIPVRKFISDNLSKILGNLSQNLTFELFMQCQCPESVGDYLDNMTSVKELSSVPELLCPYHDLHVESNSLLKYWFQNEEHSEDDDERIYDSILRKLSEDLVSLDWKFFFRALSVPENELDQVQSDYRGNIQEQIYQLLRQNPRDSLDEISIFEALARIERNDLVDKYRRI